VLNTLSQSGVLFLSIFHYPRKILR